MYIVGQDNKLLRCLTTLEAQIVMKELHEGMAGRHFAIDINAKKILDVSYWWPILFKNIHVFYRSYDSYHKIGGLKTKSLAKLAITLIE